MNVVHRVVCAVVVSVLACGCSREQPPTPGPASVGERRDFVGASSIQLPPSWSYDIARQGARSWQFSLAPDPFNLGDRCDRNGPLADDLFDRSGVFVTGFAYPAAFPRAASHFRQSPGTFALDRSTFANYEGFCRPTYRIDFVLGDLYVSTHVAVSDRAPDALVRKTLGVLNSIAASDRP